MRDLMGDEWCDRFSEALEAAEEAIEGELAALRESSRKWWDPSHPEFKPRTDDGVS